MIDLKSMIERDTVLRRTSAKHGGEYSGPCPFCGGTDRFKFWPMYERWACLDKEHGRNGCGRHGDRIDYVRARDKVGYREACERLGIPPGLPTRPARAPAMLSVGHAAPLLAPSLTWQAQGRAWVETCSALLWQPAGALALAYLRKRGLEEETLRAYRIGYQPSDVYESLAQWGLPKPPADGKRHAVWIPRGIVVPWFIDGALWRINVRRPLGKAQVAQGQPKYIGPAGFGNGLFNVDMLNCARPVVLVEGEIDALTVQQAMGDRVAAVATGSTAGSRRPAWLARLELAPVVLVAFDVDANGAGDKAAEWWMRALPNARRLRPLRGDVNAMAVAGLDVAAWVEKGMQGEEVRLCRGVGKQGE